MWEIPPDAVRIINDTLDKARKTRSFCGEDAVARWLEGEARRQGEDTPCRAAVKELARNLHMLPYRWCGVDPLLFKGEIVRRARMYVFDWRPLTSRGRLKHTEVPLAIGEALRLLIPADSESELENYRAHCHGAATKLLEILTPFCDRLAVSEETRRRTQTIVKERESPDMTSIPVDTSVADETMTPRENVLRFEGGTWKIAYEGRSVSYPNRSGFLYLKVLLANPGVPIPAFRVAALAHGSLAGVADPERRKLGKGGDITDEPPVTGAERDSVTSDLQSQVMDRKGIHEIKTEITRLRKERDDAEKRGELDKAQQFDKQTAELERLFKKNLRFDGRPRKFPDRNEKDRQTITQSIRRVLNLIRTTHPALYEHLRKSLHYGTQPMYSPTTPTFWHT